MGIIAALGAYYLVAVTGHESSLASGDGCPHLLSHFLVSLSLFYSDTL